MLFIDSNNDTEVIQENVLFLKKNAQVLGLKQYIFANCFPTIQREKMWMCRQEFKPMLAKC